MLSEEEIEKAKEQTKKWIYNMRTGMRVNIIHKGDKDFCNDLDTLLQYIDELEADKYEANNIISDYIDTWRKLKDKLEEDIKDNNQTMTDVFNYRNMQKVTKILYAQEILEIIESKGARVE